MKNARTGPRAPGPAPGPAVAAGWLKTPVYLDMHGFIFEHDEASMCHTPLRGTRKARALPNPIGRSWRDAHRYITRGAPPAHRTCRAPDMRTRAAARHRCCGRSHNVLVLAHNVARHSKHATLQKISPTAVSSSRASCSCRGNRSAAREARVTTPLEDQVYLPSPSPPSIRSTESGASSSPSRLSSSASLGFSGAVRVA